MASQSLIGWDLLFRTIEKEVKKPADILVAIVHLNLIQNSFQNIGIGDDVSTEFLEFLGRLVNETISF
jgi:PI31 proteasome regulator N-terminal